MYKKVLLTLLGFTFTLGLWAQKPQRIGYIDMEYILQNVPDYQQANAQLDQKIQKWQSNIAAKQSEIDQMKLNLSNERALLTNDLIVEREEDIALKADDLRKMQNMYFGVDGELFRLRQQLVKPVQDQVYNAVQEIAENRQYDFILDKSSDLIMLYSNDKYDISDMVVKSITRSEKQKDMLEKQEKIAEKSGKGKELSEEAQARKDAIEEKRAEQQAEKEEAVEQRQAEQQNKKKELQDRIAAQKEERERQRQEQLKAIEDARQKKIQEREEMKRKLEEKRAADQKAREEKLNQPNDK